ncbi:MAG: hypothetical protein DSM106950_13070 [Stigonema ocellatum SAG 48.90 = DSM 106950]|nr:hypothetical protein [Stigonema ocellatum SAG 48.90 = DSM 106950]
MNTKILATLTIIAAITSLGSPVHAQSSAAPNSNTGKYKLTGNSLTGINHRTAKDDFARFFPKQNYANNVGRNIGDDDAVPYTGFVKIGNQVELRRSIDEPLANPNSVIFPQANQSFNTNDGVQVEVRGK